MEKSDLNGVQWWPYKEQLMEYQTENKICSLLINYWQSRLCKLILIYAPNTPLAITH